MLQRFRKDKPIKMGFVSTRNSLILIVCLSVVTFASPVEAKTIKHCETISGDSVCEEIVSSNFNNFLWTQTVTLKVPMKLDDYVLKTQIILGVFSCTPRVAKINRFIFKDKNNRIVSVSKKTVDGLKKTFAFAVTDRMQRTCDQLYP